MAEEEEKNIEEEEEEEEEEKEVVRERKFPVKIIVLAAIFLFLFGLVFFVWKSGLLAKFTSKEESQESVEVEIGSQIGPIYTLETFIVNLVGGRGKSYLKVRLELELDGEKVREEISRRLPQFQDSVITLLSNKSFEDINTLEGKFQLRAEVMSKLNQHLKMGKITNIYFTDFIIQ